MDRLDRWIIERELRCLGWTKEPSPGCGELVVKATNPDRRTVVGAMEYLTRYMNPFVTAYLQGLDDGEAEEIEIKIEFLPKNHSGQK